MSKKWKSEQCKSVLLQKMKTPPVALTIAGADCSGGAGLQADTKVFQHHGIHGLSAVTCIVSETANVVRAVQPVPPKLVADQISLLLDSFPVAATKTGILHSAAHIACVSELMKQHEVRKLVVDPVMIASTGAPLIENEAITSYKDLLLPLASLATPNLPEAEALLGEPINSEAEAESAALKLAETHQTSILLKGGHRSCDSCDDVLAYQEQVHWFRSPRIKSAASHGTGCTLSAAITSRLALGDELLTAIVAAKEFIESAISHSYSFPGPASVDALNQGTIDFPGSS